MHIIFFNILISFVYFSVDVKMQISRSKLFDSPVDRTAATHCSSPSLAGCALYSLSLLMIGNN